MIKNRSWRFAMLCLVCGVMSIGLPSDLRADVAPPKIERAVSAALQKGATARTLIVMAEQADVSAANALASKEQKGAYVFNTLRATAERTQANVRALLTQRGIAYRAYFIANVIAVENLDADTAAQIAARPEVQRIANNPAVEFAAPVSSAPAPEFTGAIEWNLVKIGAAKLWAEKIRGQKIVVAHQDTGVAWTHPALKNKYRGYKKKTDTVDHSYNWWDAIHGSIAGGGMCAVTMPPRRATITDTARIRWGRWSVARRTTKSALRRAQNGFRAATWITALDAHPLISNVLNFFSRRGILPATIPTSRARPMW